MQVCLLDLKIEAHFIYNTLYLTKVYSFELVKLAFDYSRGKETSKEDLIFVQITSPTHSKACFNTSMTVWSISQTS